MTTFAIASRYPRLFANLESTVVYLSFATILLVVLQRLIVADAQVDWDEEAYFQMARFWRAGLIPYRDIFDIKPPMIFIFYMVTSFGGKILWTRVIVTLLLIGSGFQMFRAIQRRGWVTPQQKLFLVAALCCVLSIDAGSGTNLELVYIPFEILSFGLLLEKKPGLAGICAALVVAIKYTAVIDIAGLGVAYWFVSAEDRGRVRSLMVCGITALALGAAVYGAFYVYFALHGVDLLEAIVYRNLVHAGSSTVPIWSPDSFFMPFMLLVVKITAPVALLSGFRTQRIGLLYAALPWLALSLLQACITRQYYYHYFLPVFVPISIVWASLRVGALSLVILTPCLLGFEFNQILTALRLNDAYRDTAAHYRVLCDLINNRGYVLSGFTAAYRVCNTPIVDKFLFPAFYWDQHFVSVSQSGGMGALRAKLDRGEIVTLISTPAIWKEMGPMLEGENDRVKLVQDPLEEFVF